MTQLTQAHDSDFARFVDDVNALPAEKRAEVVLDYMNDIEEVLLACKQADVKIEHCLRDGVYTRTMNAPADVFIAGLRHKKATLTVLLEGDISVLTEKGTTRIQAPLMFWSDANTRRIGRTHSKTTWMTINAVTSTDLEDIENELFSMDD